MKKLLTLTLLSVMPFLANGQLQNADFESWTQPVEPEALLYNIATGWTRTNGIPTIEGQGLYLPPATDAQNGDYAMRLCVWYMYDKDIAYQVSSINTRPASLRGYYKYTDNLAIETATGNIVNDEAKVTVYLIKWNDELVQNDIIGTGTLSLGASADYSLFECPITYTADGVPDTIRVVLDCSLMDKTEANTHISAFESGVSSIFTVDNLWLEDTMGNENFGNKKFSVYPNPSSGLINIPEFEGSAELFDPMGKSVLKKDNPGGTMDISSLQQGIYLLKLDNGRENMTSKIVKQ